jgi:DNA replication protein DnaC
MTSSSFSFADLRSIGERAAQDQVDVNRQAAVDREQSELEKLFSRSGVPPRFAGKYFDDYVPAGLAQTRAKEICQKYADRFEKLSASGVCMVLTGGTGTGKTHLACSVLRLVMVAGRTGIFLTVTELLRSIRSTYSSSSKETETDVVARFINADLLVLDEIGLSIGKQDIREAQLFDVINGRYAALKPTVLIGNLSPAEMEKYLGVRVWDRVCEGKAPVVVFDWETYRRG